jgi:hypothetical protein
MPTEAPVAFTENFYGLPDKQTQWLAFLRKSKLETIDFEQTICQVSRFLLPILLEDVRNLCWNHTTGWTASTSAQASGRNGTD